MHVTSATVISLVLLSVCVFGHGKPIYDSESEENEYKDTEEILNDIRNEEALEGQSDEQSESLEELPTPVPRGPVYLPPIFVPSTTSKPTYFPKTNTQLGSLFEQINRARRREVPQPVDLPVPVIVFMQDSTGKENQSNYWKRFHDSVYKVD